jgi:hypothetical protein
MVSNATANPTEPDPPLGVRVALQQALSSGSLIGIDLEVFGVDVDGDVLVGVFVFDLTLHHPFEDVLSALGEF